MHAADALIEFLAESPSPYHAVAAAVRRLEASGFTALSEAERWQLEPGKGYFLLRGGKTVIAWRQGLAAPAEAGVRIAVAHTDSPTLKLRPRPDTKTRNLRYLTTEIYGGPLLYSFLDRDLKIAGALYCGERAAERVLIALDRPLVRATSLAIHLRADKGSDNYSFDREKDFLLVTGEGEMPALEMLRAAAGEALGRDPGPVLSLDLEVTESAPPARIGMAGSLISAPRLDNLFSCYTALAALLGAEPVPFTTMVALYDSEEIGSQTFTGARSNTVDGILHRIAGGSEDGVWRLKARSLVVSADMAHGEHPAFTTATDPAHVPELNKGIALKSGSMGNYAIGPGVEAWFSLICQKAGVPTQRFRYRCDHGRGSSIGPIITTGLGIAGLDVGSPMLAMHSARELAGSADVAYATAAFAAFFTAEDRLPD